MLKGNRDSALVILRVMLGVTLIFSHGLPKVLEPERWESTGRAMEAIGIGFAPTFFGFMAGASELVAGIMFVIGLAIRPAAAVMVFVMFVAAARNVAGPGLAGGMAHPIDAAAGYIVLMLLGAGSHSLDRKLGLEKPAIQEKRAAAAV